MTNEISYLIVFLGFALVLIHAVLSAAGIRLPATRYTRNGGMRFFRIGRVQMSGAWCRVAKPVRYTRNGGMSFLRVGRVQLSWCLCRASVKRAEWHVLASAAWHPRQAGVAN
jgi:hypothetical protein